MDFDTSDRLMSEAERIENILRRSLYEESSRYATAIFTPVNSRSYKCAIDGCDNRAYAKGLCSAHYIRRRNGVDMSFPVRNRKRGVACVDCGTPPNNKGGWMRCTTHYKLRRALVLKTAAVSALGGRCVRCGETYCVPVFDFHHKSAKDFAISYAFISRSIAATAAEIAKCELLCSNCHRMEHYREL